MKKSFFLIMLLLLLVVIAIGGIVGLSYARSKRVATITNFQDCKAAGYPIQETYPERCVTPDGRTFTQIIPGQTVTVTGEIVCLPHKNTNGPQTLECAFGIKDGDGNYYGLHDPEMKYLSHLPTGKSVTVIGTLSPSSPSIYRTVGTITVTSITTQ